MKKSLLKLLCSAAVLLTASVSAFADKKPWAEVAAPAITKVEQTGPNEIKVSFNSVTSNDGADKGSVAFKSDTGASGSEAYGRTRKEAKSAVFTVNKSGTYTFTVYAERNGEKVKHESAPASFKYTLPLVKSAVMVRNLGEGKMAVTWSSVPEADGYILSYTDAAGKKVSLPKTTTLKGEVALPVGTVSNFVVAATRGSESLDSDPIKKTARKEAERVWNFTEFGTSTNPKRNNFQLLDSDNLKVKLNSCTFDPKTGNIIDKGGKFETFFDGISFYYTEIDPKKENFELTATITVDYHNPMADGQEGFGVLAIDRLGVEGDPMIIAYNNSAGIITRKFTTHVNGVKKEIKNGIGARFVSGITDAIIAEGDAAISQKCINKSTAYSYDQASDAIKTGDVYRVTLKKDNTGYHAIYKKDIESEGYINTFTMYDNENEKLVQLDKDHIYVGFAVARGVNATFSDVDFKVTDPKKDPPAIPEPPELVPLKTTIDCPVTWYDSKYPFVFTSNANGTIHIEDKDGKVLVKADKVTADVDYKKVLKLKLDGGRGITDLNVTFDPEDGWRPGKKQVIAQFNSDPKVNDYEENYKPVTYMHSIAVVTFKGKELHVSQTGDIFGTGAKDSPIDLDSAIKYAKPGQTILLAGGKYYPTKSLWIERGNDGTAKARKVLKSADPANRAVLDFNGSKATVTAFNLYGNYWTIENIDITGTPDDCKALQIAGNYNEIRMVDTYLNGDTGIQIAGRSAEPPAKWPSHNLIYGCESFGNCDPAQNNADGFASKLTSGEGNIFRNCVAHHNVDDGWDLYAKIETGPIGAVLLENCIAYNNGRKIDNTGKGDGNGFKLGGDGIAVKHVIRNSVSFNNDLNGITTNSNPALIVENCTLYANKETNLNLYGKGDAKQYPRTASAKGVLSMAGNGRDKFDDDKDPDMRKRLADDSNYFYDGAQAVNKAGSKLDKAAFVSVDFENIANGLKEDGKTFNRLPRSADGVFDLGNLFKLTDKVPAGVAADYNYVVRGNGKKK
ncbi:right-handed parallel beta-helix repeat-containing protein [Treponema sp.]|uniref:right-handed parallel beta-helix repeat-containing protein n=1 Tax=Treponema sp. TaxID=166 RepID=UPI00388D3AD3